MSRKTHNISRWVARVLLVSVMACGLGGCASWSKAPPSCDGSARRPLNRSLWDWENGTPLAAPEQAAPPIGSDPLIRKGDAGSSGSAGRSAASRSHIDVAVSYHPCGKEA
ncbi:type IV secretion pathway protein [Bradyrhizobium sp. BR13661]|jgi:type IV secretion system protein VirB7|uniref:type IV secretion pathway protein n=1 Tax=Bradyrhizobium sp. BR13661 TaxID=2940622 RepID=UPI0024772C92|nr:type IV secretion pathway protein [Bradyrhizobium sp. BR13661]MDH6261705.1 type IV secretion system protein VirB7 [Bradyrhizobium sp. BR13661]